MFPADAEVGADELRIALNFLQSFEPVGVGARDCSECLRLQLKAMPADTPWRAEALKVVDGHLALLANRDVTKLKRLLHTDDAGVRGVRDLVRTLNPRPGASFARGTPCAGARASGSGCSRPSIPPPAGEERPVVRDAPRPLSAAGGR